MRTQKRLHIKNGIVSGFHDELTFEGLEVLEVSKTRVSRIVPVPRIQRIGFYLIRWLVSDDSTIADWTRRWKCLWQVQIGGEVFKPFESRVEAIAFEKKTIHERGMSR